MKNAELNLGKFAIVVSEFNQEITDKLLAGCLSRLREKNIDDRQVTVVRVPGAVEIPLTTKLLARTNKYSAIICLGAVIRGDTDHYDYVCQQVSQGCQQVMMELEIPVIFGLLTTNTIEQAEDRVGGKEGHKGADAADTAIKMATLTAELAC